MVLVNVLPAGPVGAVLVPQPAGGGKHLARPLALAAGVEGDRWSAMMFVNNFADRLAQISNAYQINVGIATFQRAAVAPPRTIGLEFNYKLR